MTDRVGGCIDLCRRWIAACCASLSFLKQRIYFFLLSLSFSFLGVQSPSCTRFNESFFIRKRRDKDRDKVKNNNNGKRKLTGG